MHSPLARMSKRVPKVKNVCRRLPMSGKKGVRQTAHIGDGFPRSTFYPATLSLALAARRAWRDGQYGGDAW